MRQLERQLSGLRYAVRVLISGAIVWFLLGVVAHVDPLWGLISAVVVTDLKVQSAMNNFVSRMLNTLIGCLTGLLFLTAVWGLGVGDAAGDGAGGDHLGRPGAGADQLEDCADYDGDCDDSGVSVALSACGLTAAMQRTGEVVVGSVVAVAVSLATAGVLRWRRARTGPPKAP